MSTDLTTPAATPAAHAAGGWRTPLELILLGAIWGGSFLFMRVAATDFGPLPLVEARLALGGLILTPFLWRARAQFSAKLWLRIAGIAAINSVIPFTLFAWGAERAPAGIGAITNAMTVMFTYLVAHFFFGERISARRLVGLTAGFVGVAILASGKTAGSGVMQAALAGTAAAVCYGFGINLVRRYLTGYPSGAIAAANLIAGSVLLAPLAAFSWPAQAIPATSWVSAVLLGVLCTGAAFVLYYRLIGRIGAPRASTVPYLLPLFGVI
jgi:drug/metabolite transporter (DMT)-like permease